MKLKELIHEVADAVKGVKYLAGVPVIEEEKGDISTQTVIDVSKQKTAIVVGWSGFEPAKQGTGIIIGDVNVVVSIFEKPVVNRKGGSGGPTICSMAEEIAKALTYCQAEGMDCPLFLKRITPIAELGGQGGGTVTCDVVFNTKTEL